MLCAVFSLCYVWDLVCLMCSLQSVLCAGFSLCYVQSLICVMCSILCLGLAAKAARVALSSHFEEVLVHIIEHHITYIWRCPFGICQLRPL